MLSSFCLVVVVVVGEGGVGEEEEGQLGGAAGGGRRRVDCDCWTTSHVEPGAGSDGEDGCIGGGGGGGGRAFVTVVLRGGRHGTMMSVCLQSRFFFSQLLHIGFFSSHFMWRTRQVALRTARQMVIILIISELTILNSCQYEFEVQ